MKTISDERLWSSLWITLEGLHIRYILGYYSGGNDEGGYDKIIFVMDDGEEIYYGDVINNKNERIRQSDLEKEMKIIDKAINTILVRYYGWFDSCPNVHGCIVVSTKSRTINRISYEEDECEEDQYICYEDIRTTDEDEIKFIYKVHQG